MTVPGSRVGAEPRVVAYNALSVVPGSEGGAATFTLNVVRHLPAALPAARLVVYAREDEARIAPSARVEVVRIPVKTAAGRVAVEGGLLTRRLRRDDVDVFISPNESLPLGVRCAVVVVAQNLVYHCRPSRRFSGDRLADRLGIGVRFAYYRRRMATAFARADAIVAVSHETKRVLAARSKLDESKTSVVYEGADSYLLPEPPSETSPRTRTLLVVSTLAPYKNLELLVDAFAKLLERSPGVKLDIVGQDWRGFARVVSERVAARGLAGSVSLVGSLATDELARRYLSSLALVHLSECESFGLPVVEAMRYGLPVVVGRASSLPEVVGDGGCVIDVDDPDEIASSIAALVDDPSALDRLSAAGRARAAQFTWRATAEGLAAASVDAFRRRGAR